MIYLRQRLNSIFSGYLYNINLKKYNIHKGNIYWTAYRCYCAHCTLEPVLDDLHWLSCNHKIYTHK